LVDEREITLAGYLKAAWRYKWLIAALIVISVGVAWGITRRSPRIYDATTTLLIPKEGTSGLVSTLTSLGMTAPGGSSQSGGPQGMMPQIPGLMLGSATPNRDVVLSVLKSRIVADAAVQQFKLQARYGAQYPSDATQYLQSLTSVTVSKEGLISLTVSETDPVLASRIANFFVEELERIMARFGLAEATRQRAFVSEQLVTARRNLAASEEALRVFQERHKAVALAEQTRGLIDAAARLKGEIIAQEVRLQVMRDFATDRDPDVVALRRRVEEMKRQFGQMQYGGDRAVVPDGRYEGDLRNGVAPSLGPEIVVPPVRLPRVGIELAALTREFRIQETLVTLLIQQLEQAKIAEAKDPPIVRVLDDAIPPVRHARPVLGVNVAMAAGGALALGLVLAGVLEFVRINRGRAVIA
jgi:uncharacterized protein involved in exopolysaccharide biosynthesis